MSKIDVTYHNLFDKILQEGYTYKDPNRKGVNRIEIPSYTFRHEFKDGFPAISTKKLHYKNVATELIWFLRGDTNIKYLVDNGCNIWNKDAYNYYLKIKKFIGGEPMSIEEFISRIKKDKLDIMTHYYKLGDLGKVYGHYWRDYDSFDQIKDIINKMINTPMSSEIIVTARNPNDKDNQALPCCHYGFQIVMRPLSFDEKLDLFYSKGYFSGDTVSYSDNDFEIAFNGENIPKYGFELHWSQRSVDTFLGLPYNIASYATLALILEKITSHKALGIQGDLKKVHLYDNSLDAVKEQMSRDVDKYDKCELNISRHDLFKIFEKTPANMFNHFCAQDFQLQNYESYPAINVEMLERDE